MILTREIATTIVKETMKTLKRNVNIMDEKGIILSSGDSERIDTFHEAAVEVVNSGKSLVIDDQNQDEWRGVKPGVNLPIHFQGEVIGVVGISGAPKEVGKFGEMVVMMTEMMIQQIYLMNQVEWKYRTREFLLEDLLSANPSYQNIRQKCRLLDIELNAPFQLVVFRLHGGQKRLILSDVYERIEKTIPSVHAVYGLINPETFVVLHPHPISGTTVASFRKCLALFYNDVQTVIGREVEKIEHVRQSYEEAVVATRLTSQRMITVEEFEPQLLLQSIDSNTREAYRQQILDDLPEDLQKTLVAFFDNHLNLSQTAKALFIHRNTLIYRIEKIKEQTGYDPRHFQEAVALQLAFWCSK